MTHKTKIILVKHGQVSAIAFPGERIDNTYGTVAAEVPHDHPIGVGDHYPAKDAVPAEPVKAKAGKKVTETPAA
ncbi:hypothetical protein [Caballeronia sp. LZ032]|uniref:hypothetical protein n=1 Tax=Caballeronia sp. LZ032 TaxID=3038565 RepID=UPI002859C4B5|nr:hypothetical protein [Caballeronia sp. LZ032]MDR5879010.1 hypothetical protein [Caballeronia sp. LZ032]